MFFQKREDKISILDKPIIYILTIYILPTYGEGIPKSILEAWCLDY